ncbi:MTRF1L release factor glutamine methyltransferase [Aplysia californica]|uniref:peptide chain release factor N(5)-glutamine methyltransferase n=1 Tax=Aplysia californica TaxID=6500 RepID=A0ABM0JS73_APLCA|nr:MTRF1L release factor glutamine methyltransferase [Aplysia californica]
MSQSQLILFSNNMHYYYRSIQTWLRRKYSGNSVKDLRIVTVFNDWKKRFSLLSVPEPDVCAEYIIAHVTGQKTLNNTDMEACLTQHQMTKVNDLCKKRLTRMPLQYVLEEWDFHDLTLKMRPPVLIPRPETEELADLCAKTLREDVMSSGHGHQHKLLEIGSGSGALTIYILKRFTDLDAVALDVSPDACQLTTDNAEAVGVKDRLTVVEGDVRNKDSQAKLRSLGPFNMLVSNPPYISTEEMDILEPEISRFEDPVALHGGPDGFDLVSEILQQAPELLSPNGHLWLEVASQHPEQVKSFLSRLGPAHTLSYVRTVQDFAGKDRFCHVRKDSAVI